MGRRGHLSFLLNATWLVAVTLPIPAWSAAQARLIIDGLVMVRLPPLKGPGSTPVGVGMLGILFSYGGVCYDVVMLVKRLLQGGCGFLVRGGVLVRCVLLGLVVVVLVGCRGGSSAEPEVTVEPVVTGEPGETGLLGDVAVGVGELCGEPVVLDEPEDRDEIIGVPWPQRGWVWDVDDPLWDWDVDEYVRDFSVSREVAQRRKDRLGVVLSAMKSIVSFEYSRVANWGVRNSEDNMSGYVLLAGSGPVCLEAFELAESFVDLEIRVGAPDSRVELVAAEARMRELFGVGGSLRKISEGGEEYRITGLAFRAVESSGDVGFPVLQVRVYPTSLIDRVPDRLAPADLALVSAQERQAMFDWVAEGLAEYLDVGFVMVDRITEGPPGDLVVAPDYGPGVPGYDPDMPLERLFRYSPDMVFYSALVEGVLSIEEPCVYIDDYILKLPEFLTRYDPATGQLWVQGDGPFVTGDKVFVGGGQGGNSKPGSVCEPRKEIRSSEDGSWTGDRNTWSGTSMTLEEGRYEGP